MKEIVVMRLYATGSLATSAGDNTDHWQVLSNRAVYFTFNASNSFFGSCLVSQKAVIKIALAVP